MGEREQPVTKTFLINLQMMVILCRVARRLNLTPVAVMGSGKLSCPTLAPPSHSLVAWSAAAWAASISVMGCPASNWLQL